MVILFDDGGEILDLPQFTGVGKSANTLYPGYWKCLAEEGKDRCPSHDGRFEQEVSPLCCCQLAQC